MKKRLLAILLAILVIVAVLPFAIVFGGEAVSHTVGYSSGTLTAEFSGVRPNMRYTFTLFRIGDAGMILTESTADTNGVVRFTRYVGILEVGEHPWMLSPVGLNPPGETVSGNLYVPYCNLQCLLYELKQLISSSADLLGSTYRSHNGRDISPTDYWVPYDVWEGLSIAKQHGQSVLDAILSGNGN
ncbi:MAG: hypothetical protein FWB96_08865 [Defluviitaleaceae bacterium]|nr:hypothetical protein [Defluviitaleaceae bacterium]MCL2262967.1 hypothetical protein [Defluviitaleaceae bacterium]